MPLYCEETGFPATFNLVPCLIDQLEKYTSGELSDEHLELTSKPIEELTQDDKQQILRGFFSVNKDNLISRFPRYLELRKKYGFLQNNEIEEIVNLIPTEDYLDLTILFNLAWFGEHLREDREVKKILAKGRGFTLEERDVVIKKQIEWIGKTLDTYRRLWDEGIIDISFSPYYHPILPLLCDTKSAIEANSSSSLPENSMEHPDDAKAQILRAISKFEKTFGRKPFGMWPSEGSVSETMLGLLSDHSIEWIATDEAILNKSIRDTTVDGFRARYLPWKLAGTGAKTSIIFRDHRLSDKIGFDYSRITPSIAIDDFISKLKSIRDGLPEDGEYIVNIILDGENAWEFFPSNGREFLIGLYRRILSEDWLKPVKISDFIKNHPPRNEISTLASGSWIDGDFGTWIGNPEKNRAWDELILARKAIESSPNELLRSEAIEHLFVAEGSDWFWWFGRGINSSSVIEFDILFRERLSAVYRSLDLPMPESLDTPIIHMQIESPFSKKPFAYIHPRFDGKRTNFFEWQGAGLFENKGFFGAMHSRTSSFDIARIYYGFNKEYFFLRIDPDDNQETKNFDEIKFTIEISASSCLRIIVGPKIECFKKVGTKNQWKRLNINIEAAVDEVIELGIPLKEITTAENKILNWNIATNVKGKLREKYPKNGYFEVSIPKEDFEAENWMA